MPSTTGEQNGIARGLLLAVLVVVYTQIWLWNDKNQRLQQALFNLDAEVSSNRSFVATVTELVNDALRTATHGMPVIFYQPYMRHLRFPAYEQSTHLLADARPADGQAVSLYYTRLGQLQSVIEVAVAFDEFQDQSRMEMLELRKQARPLPKIDWAKGQELADKAWDAQGGSIKQMLSTCTEQGSLSVSALNRLHQKVARDGRWIWAGITGVPLLLFWLSVPVPGFFSPILERLKKAFFKSSYTRRNERGGGR
jgi:hypothetical protein